MGDLFLKWPMSSPVVIKTNNKIHTLFIYICDEKKE